MKSILVQENGVSSQFDVYEFGTGSPCLTFTGGIHGNEVSGIYVAQQLIKFLSENPPAHGRVKIIPIVNPTAMRCMQRRSPFDGQDLNRIFPGNKTGSISFRIANALWEETADADYTVDLHCCGQHGLPYILSTYTENEKAKNLTDLITMPIAVRSEGTPGQFFTESCRVRHQAALIIELPSAPSAGAINMSAAQCCLNGLMSMMCAIGFVSGKPEGNAPELHGPLLDMAAPHAGLWTPGISKGISVAKGALLGYLDNEAVYAENTGYIMSVTPMSYIFQDDLDVAIYV